MTTDMTTHIDMESTAMLVGDPGLLPRLLPLGTGVDPYREVDQHARIDPFSTLGGQLACLSSSQQELDAHAGRSAPASVTCRIAGFVANDVVYATRLPFDPGSPARGAASYVEGCWSPMLRWCHWINEHAKVTRTVTREIQRRTVEDLTLSGGASIRTGTFQAEHHLLVGNC